MSAASRAASRWPVICGCFRASTPRADGRSWGRSPSRATACCACCWWKRRRPRCVTIPSFVESICIAVTRSRKRWPRWQRHASWRYDCTGCCAPSSRIQPLFGSRAARGCPWSARARPKELIGRSRIPHRRDVRIAESWPSVRSNRWLVERLHRRVIQVRFPESWSSTFSGEKAVLTHRPGYFCLDNAFALIEGHPRKLHLDTLGHSPCCLGNNPVFHGEVFGLSFGRSEEHTSELQSPDHLVCR